MIINKVVVTAHTYLLELLTTDYLHCFYVHVSLCVCCVCVCVWGGGGSACVCLLYVHVCCVHACVCMQMCACMCAVCSLIPSPPPQLSSLAVRIYALFVLQATIAVVD